jgi:hypothetical protein
MLYDINSVEKAYAGKCGCMCGCNGRYSYNKGVAREDWQGKVNVARVKRIAEEIFADDRAVLEVSGNMTYAYVEDRAENVMKAVYFKHA